MTAASSSGSADGRMPRSGVRADACRRGRDPHHAAPGSRRSATDRAARSPAGDRIHRTALGVRRLDHRIGLAVRRPGGARDRGPGGDHLVGDRRGGDPAARARPRRARRDVSRRRRHRALPALRVRWRRRGLVRVVLVAAGRHRGADRGDGRHPVRPALLVRERLDEGQRRSERPDGERDRRRGRADGGLHGDQLPQRPQAREHEQRRDLVEGLHPGAHHRRARGDRLQRLELLGRRRLLE
jgi:hypothetical protein